VVTDADTAVHVVEHEIVTDAPKVDRVETLDAYGLAPPLGFSFPEGMYSFRIEGLTPGSRIEIRFYLSKPFLAGDKWWKYDAIHGWQDYTTRIVSGIGTKRVTLEFKDGGFGDADGVAFGVIIDPSGPGKPQVLRGDLNADNVTNIADVILCLRIALRLPITIGGEIYSYPYPPWLIGRADMNADEKVNIADVILTLRRALGLDA
jgi:hypothetical protein